MNRKYLRTGVSISLGLCFGAAWGTALHNPGVGIALGVSLGTVFGAALGMAPDAPSAPKKPAGEQPLPRPLGL